MFWSSWGSKQEEQSVTRACFDRVDQARRQEEHGNINKNIGKYWEISRNIRDISADR